MVLKGVISMNLLKNPCSKDCKRRSWDCHNKGNCIEFDKYQERKMQYNEIKRKTKTLDAYFYKALYY